MAKRSKIEQDELSGGWAIYCCECGEYLETVAEKPEHNAFACYQCEDDLDDLC